MKYILLVYVTEETLNQTDRQHCYETSTQLTHDLSAQGKFVAASPLHPISTATSVRVREGKRLVTDGPFAETREQLGGFYIVNARDLDDAIEIASRIPVANIGTIEIRPILELPGLPANSATPTAREPAHA